MTVVPDTDDGGQRMNVAQIKALYDRTKGRFTTRDGKMNDVLAVRQGRMNEVFPQLMDSADPVGGRSLVANMVDAVARDLSEVLAPLPAFNCTSGKMNSDRSREFADRRTRIVNGYSEFSELQSQMYTAADRYVTYGFVPAMVEVDVDEAMPRIRFLESQGAYPVFNRWGQISAGFFKFMKTKDELVAMFPHAKSLLSQTGQGGNTLVEVVRYHDKFVDLLYLPTSEGMILEQTKNPVGECLIEWVQRPSMDGESHGQFDDVLAVQVARSRFAALALDAAQKSVQAPIVMPTDAQELALGPDSIIRTANPEKVGRLKLDVPQAAFAQQALMENELRNGARYPEARGGHVDGSIVTGRGVEALMGGFDTQLRTGQSMFAGSLMRLMAKALLVDEKLWPDTAKTVRGNADGAAYEVSYTPSKDIKGDYTVDVQYGLMAGLDPNSALIFGLQAHGAGLISKDFLRRQMPFALNASEQEQQIDVEELREGLKQGLAGIAQSIPALIEQGQDPTKLLTQLADVIHGIQSKKPIEDLIRDVFAPPPAPPSPGVEPPVGPEMPVDGGTPPGGGGMIGPDGLMPGVAQGQQGMAPGGRPSVQQLMASVGTGGQPGEMSVGTVRRIAIQ